jgi:drug/metabolite transporter (DMT)-like permease
LSRLRGEAVPLGAPDRPLPTVGFVLLGLLTLFWGINFPIMRVALGEITPWYFRVLCLSTGGLGLLAITRARGRRLGIPRRELGPLVLIALVNITGWQLLTAYALTMMEAGRAVIIAYTMPLWAILLARLMLGEPITLLRTAGLALGLGGLAVLGWPAVEAMEAAPWGALCMLGAALCWATGTILMKYFRWSMPTSELVGWQLLFGGLPVFIGAPLIEALPDPSRMSAAALAAIAYAAVVPMIFCHYAYYTVVRLFPAALATLGTVAIPVIGVLTGAAVLGEPIGWREITALVMVVAALALVLLVPVLPRRRVWVS